MLRIGGLIQLLYPIAQGRLFKRSNQSILLNHLTHQNHMQVLQAGLVHELMHRDKTSNYSYAEQK